MTILQVTDGLRVSIDSYNYTVEVAAVVGAVPTTKGRKALAENIGKVVWKTEGHYGSLEQALRACLTERLRTKLEADDSADLMSVLEALAQAKAEIRTACAGIGAELVRVENAAAATRVVAAAAKPEVKAS